MHACVVSFVSVYTYFCTLLAFTNTPICFITHTHAHRYHTSIYNSSSCTYAC
eukprot:m.384925 g.384925  ORF g.384925 m.384925 type:complete len:52 (+) comp134721_c0_seq1:51-206(+)